MALGELLPGWSVAPFALLLLAIAVLPLALPHFWESNRNKALVAAALGLPMLVWMAALDFHVVLHTAHEYVAFILLLAALFIISGGVVVRGNLAGTPGVNTSMLALGTMLASLVGTTGASMLLIRPLLRANAPRKRKAHVVVFFIFLVSNIGGLLTPLGDPPLFLGFLRGVPFAWTLGMWLPWLFSTSVLLFAFYVVDSTIFRREDLKTPGDLDEVAVAAKQPFSVAGKRNFLYLGGVILVILGSGQFSPPWGVQEAGLIAMAALSWLTTPKPLRQENQFGFAPINEVAVVFAGIFATMIPALAILNSSGKDLGIVEPWQFFWATGALSSFLDNAPTYLTFASTASSLLGTDVANLSTLLSVERGTPLLTAISLGAVFMGANTYIGNGPNFMVKAVAEQAGVKMPSFFGYMVYSVVVLLPLFGLVTLLFL
jgi:Na+/H+ antiporter NhaD/arsenite permease-like protein